MEQAGEVDYLITWRDNEFVGRVSLTPCRRAGANRRCFAFPKSPSCLRLCLHLPALLKQAIQWEFPPTVCPLDTKESAEVPHSSKMILLG